MVMDLHLALVAGAQVMPHVWPARKTSPGPGAKGATTLPAAEEPPLPPVVVFWRRSSRPSCGVERASTDEADAAAKRAMVGSVKRMVTV